MADGQVIEQDQDPAETQEWLDAVSSVATYEGPIRARYLLDRVIKHSQLSNIDLDSVINTPYVNSIAAKDEALFPGDTDICQRIRALLRWNAVMMVLRAGKKDPALGGHIASFASAAMLYEVGFHYFFRARSAKHPGDLVFIQGHSAPGIYAHAFLEGRIDEKLLDNFRQESKGEGLSSYPHPWLMPDFWQFPTVSMGLGPLQGIYQARFLKYLENRGLYDNQDRKVWVFCGDGEMDEPESLGAISLGSREKLDNLIFVINCNLQRLDGPVRGNYSIIQELEGIFRGAGWNVLKVLWGTGWDKLFEKDKSGLLIKRMGEVKDGEYQTYRARDGAYVREHFFGKYPELLELVADMSDKDIWNLQRGGHDPQKVYAAYDAAIKHKGQPTVILAKTVKGYGMGAAGEGKNITHQQKKMSFEHLEILVDRFNIPIDKEKIPDLPYYNPGPKSAEVKYINKCRKALGGPLPARHSKCPKLIVPKLQAFDALLKGFGDKEMSTTMIFVRILNVLLKDKNISKHVVPISADESRTFGMEGLFRQIGIYSPEGQLYEPEDKDTLMYYREVKDGQLLEEGINEAGSLASWVAAATSYSISGLPMIPLYIFYSMFGFQRIGDLAWAAADMRARGFLIGSLSGRTTLAGEGLQHTDGHNHIMFSVVPTCQCYDPTFAFELAVIMQDGMRRMYQDQEDIYYYITAGNENYTHPTMPKGAEEGIIKGMYLFQKGKSSLKHKVQLLGSGAILREVIKAAEILEKDYKISADVWSVTSFTQLRREAMNVERDNRLQVSAKSKPKVSYVTKCLQEKGPVIAATDYMKLFSDQIQPYVPQRFVSLGTDGFGLSDTRAALREYFEVDANMIAYTALKTLADEGELPLSEVSKAMKKLGINAKKANPMQV